MAYRPSGNWQGGSRRSSRSSASPSRGYGRASGVSDRSHGTPSPSGHGFGGGAAAGSNRNFKLGLAFIILAALALLACGRLFWLQVVDAQANLDRNGSGTYELTIEARRGTIYDTNGAILATTVDTVNVFCHPHLLTGEDMKTIASFLVENCGGEESDYTELMTSDANFKYLVKGADEKLGDKIRELDIKGLDYERSNKRVYPSGAVGSQVIGMLNTEGDALTGLELYYDDILSGSDGKKVASYSKEGVPIPGGTTVIAQAVDGKDIVVSIDIELQREVEESLLFNYKETKAETGSAIVMDAETGEILACASCPTFDITDTSKIEPGATNLSGISLAFEPGSIFKPAIMLAALEEGTTKAGQKYDCPTSLKVGEYTISDAHDRGAERMSTTDIIANSSNVGMSLIAKDLGKEKMDEYIKKYQLLDPTGVDYPGEVSGYVADVNDWSVAQTYNIAFGQGLTISPIELVRFYGALANDGVATTPHFLVSVPSEGEPRSYETTEIVENKKVLSKLVKMMEAVTEEGTGTTARVDGYRVAGKTGTAQTSSSEGYSDDIYNVDFAGFFPDASRKLVCYVGEVNAPGEYKTTTAFQDIMTFAADRYDITQE